MRGHVLIADDDMEMRRLLGESLAQVGFTVEQAADGVELQQRLTALQAVGRPPDLVITDVQMPGLTGLGVLAWMHKVVPSIKVILITAFGDDQTHTRAADLGAALVLDKPFDLEALHGAIDQLLPPS